MKRILISGLVNMETTLRVRQFPISYYPIDYPFFGIDSAASGVAYNIALAMKTLNDEVQLCSMTGQDFPASYIKEELQNAGIGTESIKAALKATSNSVVLYDGEGKRQIYCDLKDIQEMSYGFDEHVCDGFDLVAACNINFNRELLRLAKAAGKVIATDVHVLTDVRDDYNRDFMEAADLLFLSDEGISGEPHSFLLELFQTYGNQVIVLGRGSKGALMYLREEERFVELPAVQVGPVVNTVGAGDALFSAFLHYYAKGLSPVEALIRAELFASAKIGVSGAARGFVTEEQVEALYERFGGKLL